MVANSHSLPLIKLVSAGDTRYIIYGVGVMRVGTNAKDTGSSRAHAAHRRGIVVMSAASEKALIRDNVHYWVLFWRVYMNKGWQDKQSVLLSSSVRWFAGLSRRRRYMQQQQLESCARSQSAAPAQQPAVHTRAQNCFVPLAFLLNQPTKWHKQHTPQTRAFVRRILCAGWRLFAGILSYKCFLRTGI